MKACRDCKFYRYSRGPGYNHVCNRPDYMADDPIYGKIPRSAENLRAKDGSCGPDAAGFTQKLDPPAIQMVVGQPPRDHFIDGILVTLMVGLPAVALGWVLFHG